MAYDSTPRALNPSADTAHQQLMPEELKHALQDPAIPHEVKAVILELWTLDPVNATLEARILQRALDGSHRESVGLFGGGVFMRKTLRDWELDLPEARRDRSAAQLVEVMSAWSDAALRAVL